MKAARLYEYDAAMAVDLRIENVREPTIMKPDEVIVKVGAAGLCRTDLHIIEGVWKDIMDHDGHLWVGDSGPFGDMGLLPSSEVARGDGAGFGCTRTRYLPLPFGPPSLLSPAFGDIRLL